MNDNTLETLTDILVENCDIDIHGADKSSQLAYRLGQATVLLMLHQESPIEEPEEVWSLPTEPRYYQLEHSEERITQVHSAGKCAGEHCVIHNKSGHCMRAFPQHWRIDTGMMERICPHGTGHPDIDNPWPESDARWVHGCCQDGCCS